MANHDTPLGSAAVTNAAVGTLLALGVARLISSRRLHRQLKTIAAAVVPTVEAK